MLIDIISLTLTTIMGFAVIAAVLILKFCSVVNHKYIANYLIYYLTISLGILAVVLLTITNHLGDSVVGSILSGVFGYVLGRHEREGTIDLDDTASLLQKPKTRYPDDNPPSP